MAKTSDFRTLLCRLCAGGSMAAMLSVALVAVPDAAKADAPQKNVCLWVNRIDHTQVLNDHQILFFENGGKIWQSNLPAPCRTLTSQDGFIWRSGIPEICGNVEQIRVIRTGESCLLGAFQPYVVGGAQPVGTSAPKSDRWMN